MRGAASRCCAPVACTPRSSGDSCWPSR
jgi:hypothetical protein